MNARPLSRGSHRPSEVQLGVSLYDQVASLLVSLLIVVGASVALMFFLWVAQMLEFRPQKFMPVPPERVARQSDEAGFERELEALCRDELPELSAPQLVVELQAVADAASSVATFETESVQAIGTGPEKGNGETGARFPDNQPADNQHNDIVPRWKRWQIRWIATDLPSYARQLDFFKIELGVAGGKPLVDYASNLSLAQPATRKGPPAAERRLYMTWKEGKLLNFEKAILRRAGIPTNDRVLFQFLPAEVENQLAVIEKRNADREGHPSVKEFRKTWFGVRTKGKGYEFYVDDQQFRPAPQ